MILSRSVGVAIALASSVAFVSFSCARGRKDANEPPPQGAQTPPVSEDGKRKESGGPDLSVMPTERSADTFELDFTRSGQETFFLSVHVPAHDRATLLAVDLRDRIWRSPDRGRTWSLVCRIPRNVTEHWPHYVFASDVATGKALVRNDFGGEVVRVESAAECPRANTGLPAASLIRSLRARAGGGLEIVSSVWGSTGKPSRVTSVVTADGGQTFTTRFDAPLPLETQLRSTFSPLGSANRIALLLENWGNGKAGILLTSVDEGRNWKRKDAKVDRPEVGVVGGRLHLCGETDSQNEHSDDFGETWLPTSAACPGDFVHDEQERYALDADGLGYWRPDSRRLLDPGASWDDYTLQLVKVAHDGKELARLDLPCCLIGGGGYSHSVVSASGATVAYTAQGRLFVSADGGKSFSPVSRPPSEPPLVSFSGLLRLGTQIFALTPQGAVLASSAPGAPGSWAQLVSFPHFDGFHYRIPSLAVPSTFLFFVPGLSLDGGRTWIKNGERIDDIAPSDPALVEQQRGLDEPNAVVRVESWSPFKSVDLGLRLPTQTQLRDEGFEWVDTRLGGTSRAPLVAMTLSKGANKEVHHFLRILRPGLPPETRPLPAHMRVMGAKFAVVGGKETLVVSGAYGGVYGSRDLGKSFEELLPPVQFVVGGPNMLGNSRDGFKKVFGHGVIAKGQDGYGREPGYLNVGTFVSKKWERVRLPQRCQAVDVEWQKNELLVACAYSPPALIRMK